MKNCAPMSHSHIKMLDRCMKDRFSLAIQSKRTCTTIMKICHVAHSNHTDEIINIQQNALHAACADGRLSEHASQEGVRGESGGPLGQSSCLK